MNAFETFQRQIARHSGTRVDKAVLMASALKRLAGKPSCTIKGICDEFEGAHLARPNPTILLGGLKSDRRVSVRDRTVRALAKADEFFDTEFPDIQVASEEAPKLSADVRVILGNTPFIEAPYIDDLEKMLSLYAQLHTLENSMRRLIEKVLLRKSGPDWWDRSASVPQKRKHTERLEKEKTRKWLPARSSLGPLYSLDWSDLISLMRKFEADFIPYVGEIDFLHRFNDLGLMRHVVAHHGFIDDEAEFDRVKLALKDWQKQISDSE